MKETDKILYDYPHLKYYEAVSLAKKVMEGSGFRSG